jgi:hypothetical protein
MPRGCGRSVAVAGLRQEGRERGAFPLAETSATSTATFTGLHKIVLILFALTFA